MTCIFFVFGALLEYSIILLHLKIYSVMQGLPENPTLLSLSRSVLPAGVLAGDLPGNPKVTGSVDSQRKSMGNVKDGSPTQNENGRTMFENERPSRDHGRSKRFISFKSREEPYPRDAAAKMIRKNRMIARQDIVCLIIFPIVFLLYAVIYLMTTAW